MIQSAVKQCCDRARARSLQLTTLDDINCFRGSLVSFVCLCFFCVAFFACRRRCVLSWTEICGVELFIWCYFTVCEGGRNCVWGDSPHSRWKIVEFGEEMAHHHQHHRSCGVDKQLRKIDEIFMNQKENEVRIIESRTSHNCSVHGSHRRGSVCSLAATAASKKRDYVVGSSMADLRRPSYGSIYNVGREEEMAKRKARLANRNSIAHFGDLYSASSLGANRFNPDRRRDSLPVLNKPVRPMEHPSDFPSMLRTTSVSTVDLRRKPSVTNRSSTASKRSSLNLDDHHIHLPFATSTGKLHSILKNKASSPSKDSETSTSDQDLCDLTKRLSFDSGIAKQPLLSNRRNSNDSSYSSYSRRISIDSLDARRNSRRFSDASSMFGAGDDDAGSTCGTTGGGIDLDRIRLLNKNFSNSFSGASGDKREVRETKGNSLCYY